MIKNILATSILLLIVLSGLVPAQQSGNKWMFCAITVIQESDGCYNNIATKYGYVWIKADDKYDHHIQKLKDSLNNQYGNKYSITPIEMDSAEPRYVAVVRRVLKCGNWELARPVKYQFYHGKNKENIIAGVENEKQENYLSYEIIEYISGIAQLENLSKAEKMMVAGRKIDYWFKEPTHEQIQQICGAARNVLPDYSGHGEFLFVRLLYEQSNTNRADPEKEIKVCKYWNTYYDKIICPKNTLAHPKGGVLKALVTGRFNEMLKIMVRDFKLDLNVLDPIDNTTILDYVKSEMADDIYTDDEIHDLQEIHDLLRSGGAKYSHEL